MQHTAAFAAALDKPGGVPWLQSFAGLWEVAQSKGVPLRTAAFIKALQRVTRHVETCRRP